MPKAELAHWPVVEDGELPQRNGHLPGEDNTKQNNFSGFSGSQPDGPVETQIMPGSVHRTYQCRQSLRAGASERVSQGLNPLGHPPDSSCQYGGFSSNGSLVLGAPFHTRLVEWDSDVEFPHLILPNSC